MTRIRIPALALTLLALAVSPAAAQTTLRYKFKEGETLNYAMDQKMKMSMNIMGKAIDMNMEQTSQLSWKVLALDSDGAAKLEMKFGRTKLTMDMPMGKLEIDSDSPEPDDPQAKVMHGVVKAMAGLTVVGKMSARGELSDVQMPADAAKRLKGIPGAELMGDMLTPDGFKQMMSQSGLVLPEGVVKKDDTWQNKMNIKLPIGKITGEIVYTYAGPGSGGEKVALAPKMTIQADPNAPFALTMKSQKGTGEAIFDNAAGRLKQITLNQTMELEVEVMGQTVSQRVVQTTTTRLVNPTD